MSDWYEYSANDTHKMLEMLDQCAEFVRDARNHMTNMDRSIERARIQNKQLRGQVSALAKENAELASVVDQLPSHHDSI